MGEDARDAPAIREKRAIERDVRYNRVPGYNNVWSKGECLVIRVQRHKTRGESRIDRGEIVLARVQCGNGSPPPFLAPNPFSFLPLSVSIYVPIFLLIVPFLPPSRRLALAFSPSFVSAGCFLLALFSLTGFFVPLHFLPFLLFCTKVFSFSLVVTIHSVQWTRSSARGGEIPGTRLAEYRHRPRETS